MSSNEGYPSKYGEGATWHPLLFSSQSKIEAWQIQDLFANGALNPRALPHMVRPDHGLGRRDTHFPLKHTRQSEVVLKLQKAVIADAIFRISSSIGHYAFEVLTGDVFSSEIDGYLELTPRVGDGGIDLIIHSRESSVSTHLVQCKQYSTPVGKSEMEAFIHDAEVWADENLEDTELIFVALGGFTGGAITAAENWNVQCIDGQELAELAMRNRIGVRECTFQLLDEQFWSEMANVR